MFSRAKSYIIKAGTIILVCNAVVSIMASYTWTFTEAAENASNSILASIAHPISVLLIPLGFGTWKFAAAAVTGFIAKEDVVGTLATVFAISVEASEGKGETMFGITAVAGLAYLMFNLYTPPCFAAIGAMNAEIKSKKWLFAGIGLQFAVGYIVAFLVYQVGTLIVDKTVGEALVPGIIAVAAIIAAVTILSLRTKKKTEAEYANKAKAK